MIVQRYSFIIILILFFCFPSLAENQISFGSLLKKMLQNNDLLITKVSIKKQEEVDKRTTSRLNAPTFIGTGSYTSIDIFQNSPTNFETNMEVTRMGAGIQGSLPRFGLGYTFNYGQSEQFQSNYLTQPEFSVSGKTVALGVEVDLLEDAGFLVGDILFEEQRLEYELADSSYSQQVQSNVLNLIKLYLKTTLAQQKIVDTAFFQAQSEKLYKSYRRLFDEGKLSKVELLSAKIQVNNQKTTMLNFVVDYKQAKRELFRFVGGMEAKDLQKEWKFKVLKSHFLINDLEHEKLKFNSKNPDVTFLQKQIDLSNLRMRSFRNKLLPTLTFSGGYQKNENPFIQPLTGLDYGSNQWSTGLSISIPLDNIGAKADLDKEKVLQHYLKTQEELLLTNIELVIEGISIEIEQIKAQRDITKENLKLAHQRYLAALPLVRINSATRIDIFFYQNELTALQYRLIELEAAIVSRRADVLYARGKFGLRKMLQ